jgi:hypothetical protein
MSELIPLTESERDAAHYRASANRYAARLARIRDAWKALHGAMALVAAEGEINPDGRHVDEMWEAYDELQKRIES